MYTGWTASDSAEKYAQQATAVAEASREREATLSAEHPRSIFQLGIRYGYSSQWLAGVWSAPRPQSVGRSVQEMQRYAEVLGLGTIEPLTARSEGGFNEITQGLEHDAGGRCRPS